MGLLRFVCPQIFGCRIGALLRDAPTSLVRSNTIFLNRDCGLYLQDVGAVVVADNVVSCNGQLGLCISGSGSKGSVVSVQHSRIQYNGVGIGFTNGAKIVLENCTIAGNRLFALSIVDAAKEPAMPENIASG